MNTWRNRIRRVCGDRWTIRILFGGRLMGAVFVGPIAGRRSIFVVAVSWARQVV